MLPYTFDFTTLTHHISPVSLLFFKDFVRGYYLAQDVLLQGQEKIYSFPSFGAEIFHRLYYDAQPTPLDSVPPENGWVLKLHNEFIQLPEYEQLIRMCEGNPVAAGLGVTEFCTQILRKLPAPQSPLQNPQSLRNAVKALKRKASSEGLSLEEQAMLEQLIQQGTEAVAQALAYADALDESQLRASMRQAADKANEAVQQAQETMEAFGIGWGNEDGTAQRLSVEEKIKLASRLASDRRLQKIAFLAGRMREETDRKRRCKSTEGYGELVGITTGNEISRLLPSELQKLAVPDLQPMFALGYYERSLLEYEIQGMKKKARGPLVICVDVSGSMNGIKDEWAKALCLTFAYIAREDKRHFRIIQFSNKVERIDDFPVNQPNQEALLEAMAGYYCGGGTNFDKPLREAVKCIENTPELNKADLIFITDGDCSVSDKFLEQFSRNKDDFQFNSFGILIGNSSKDSLPFCDRVWQVKEGELDNAAVEELFNI